MRRFFLALTLALGAPLAAAAQTPATGQILFDGSTTGSINLAQCTGQANSLRTDDMTVGLTWALSTSTTSFATGGAFQLFVANQQVDSTVSAVSCRSTNTTYKIAQVGTGDLNVSDQNPMTAVLTVTRQELAAAIAQATGQTQCSAALPSTIYLCVQWFLSSTESGRATGALALDVVPPAAPTAVTAVPGDGRLHVSWTGISVTGATYKAFAVNVADPTNTKNSGEVSTTSADISGLTNGSTYSVKVYAFDSAENPSAASVAVTGTPQLVSDFWDVYKGAGGQETGGCSAGAAGAVALLGTALSLLAARRRKS